MGARIFQKRKDNNNEIFILKPSKGLLFVRNPNDYRLSLEQESQC